MNAGSIHTQSRHRVAHRIERDSPRWPPQVTASRTSTYIRFKDFTQSITDDTSKTIHCGIRAPGPFCERVSGLTNAPQIMAWRGVASACVSQGAWCGVMSFGPSGAGHLLLVPSRPHSLRSRVVLFTPIYRDRFTAAATILFAHKAKSSKTVLHDPRDRTEPSVGRLGFVDNETFYYEAAADQVLRAARYGLIII